MLETQSDIEIYLNLESVLDPENDVDLESRGQP
jgi:hypothetical protein